MRTASRFHLLAGSEEPPYRQLIRQIKHAVATRVLNPGDRMPAVRALARELRINPNTVARAYRELDRDGLLETAAGRGTFVKPTRAKVLPTRLRPAEGRARLKPSVERIVSEGRLLGLSDTELRGLLQRALRDLPRRAG